MAQVVGSKAMVSRPQPTYQYRWGSIVRYAVGLVGSAATFALVVSEPTIYLPRAIPGTAAALVVLPVMFVYCAVRLGALFAHRKRSRYG